MSELKKDIPEITGEMISDVHRILQYGASLSCGIVSDQNRDSIYLDVEYIDHKLVLSD
ncbi:Uncharacterised protein [Acinetobacter baumannii]|nr:hypothetical protein F911_02669 [Acinetobacter baumannii ATCC 19606 = CIP 70.34 = JCM 6841]QFQ04736.1 hypothetical protein FQU82_01303 [Acinetobacter phage vB_AbaS_LC1] [Acinetobacter baumannii]KFC03564.1 hypothetical protein DJ41_2330 [Acinetobacter baumannii ATCC 19606 = CIP 70.34 = JCM 6841]QXV70179.1 hypothetical protein HTZ92_2254 [Acinetobacter baumannii ATCC 19606 = CIP 70.34 = JCM 6841]SUU02171.1 Uncharacterised protein [Acinetobacter baumannii]